MMRCFAFLLACAAFALPGAACSSSTHEAPRDDSLDGAPSPDADAPDVANEPDAAGGDEPAPLELPVARALPLGRDDLLDVSSGDEVDIASTMTVGPAGEVTGFFDRSDADFTTSKILRFSSKDGRHFTRSTLTQLGASTFTAGPSLVTTTNGTHLYWATSSSLQSPSTVHRARVEGRSLLEEEALPAIPGVDWILSWPTFTNVGGGVGVAYRDGASVPMFAASADGRTFRAAVPLSDTGGAMASVTELRGGALVYTFQRDARTEAMTSFVRISRDGGATWSKDVPVTDGVNVHDTAVIARADGRGGDLYYIYPPPSASGFVLFRRSITEAGELGVEEQVTKKDAFEPSKPSLVRLPNGHLLLAVANIAERKQGLPVVQRLLLAELAGDAP